MKLSIGMMVKNEEKNLERCLQSIQPLRDAIDSELIIIDTGSNDNTVEIAKKYTNKLYFHEWNNNFSEMRNMTIQYAQGEWFFVIDADEEVEDCQPLISFLKMKNNKEFNSALLFVKNLTDEHDPTSFSTLLSARLFRKTLNFRYEGAVHNKPVFEGPTGKLEANLIHYGYIFNDQELMERKFMRTGAILKAELAKDPENIYHLYQLSVTYSMHGDQNEAIEYIEKAYQALLLQGKSKQYMYVLAHMALVYQIARNYKKVEEVCLEALQISKGYLDIYYYLAEAQAVLEKDREAIQHYLQYLALRDNYYNDINKDMSTIDYTLGKYEIAYYNLSLMYKKIGDFTQALYYAEKINDQKYIQDNLQTTIFSYMKLARYSGLRKYYDMLQEEAKPIFYEVLEKIKSEFDEEAQFIIAGKFSDLPDYYGLLSKMICDDHKGGFSKQTLEDILKIDFSALPAYCSMILYYLLKWHYPLEKLLVRFKEIWLAILFDHIMKTREDVGKRVYEFLERYDGSHSLSGYKLSKSLCRFVLLENKVGEAEYKVMFLRYINDGLSYLKAIYNSQVLTDELVYEVKNDEEVFFIYMYQAYCQRNSNEAEYIRYLRKALQVFPIMHKGIYMLLQELESAKKDTQDEFENYKKQIKVTIKECIDNSQWDNAQEIINEYKEIVADDMEIILFESEIALKQAIVKPLVN